MHGYLSQEEKKNVISETGTVMLINLCSNLFFSIKQN